MAALSEVSVTDVVQVREELGRVLGSQTFAKSPRLSSLLEFIVTHSLEGRTNELTEQQIGIQVFGRAPGYNSSDDTIVRGTARSLRQRLELYYSGEGAQDAVRIEIPRGAYVAVFHEGVGQASVATVLPDAPAPSVVLPEPVRPETSGRAVWWLGVAVVALAVALAGVSAAYFSQQRGVRPAAELSGPQAVWHALFAPGRKTIIVPGDESLDAFVAWEQKPVSLDEYAGQHYHERSTVSKPPTHMDVPLSVRSATPMADLVLVSTLVRAPEHMGEPELENSTEVRYARDLAIADTHANNLILIGSETFNPWTTLYQPEMDFVAHFDFAKDIYRVENKAVRPGEQAEYVYDRGVGDRHKAITHVALLNNTQGTGRVLVVEGTSMGSTYSAVNFFTREALWVPVVAAATDGRGRLHDFEVLLSGDLIHGGVGNTKVIAEHVH